MQIEPVDDWRDPRLRDYQNVRDPQLLSEHGVFIAESREVVRILLSESPMRVRSLLLNESTLEALEPLIASLDYEVAVYVAGRDVFRHVLGFDIHRGCLAAGERGAHATLPPRATKLLALDGVANPDNVGSSFRNALAFGVEGVLVGPGTTDPLYRKAIRTSMGASLRLPFVCVDDWQEALAPLRSGGARIIGMTPDLGAVAIEQFSVPDRWVLVVGHEGEGLSQAVQPHLDDTVRLPMADGVDSINVATATAIGLYRLFVR